MSYSPILSESFRHTPTEIILQIVDAAGAQSDRTLALSLALVASWVRARVDKFIYRTVVLSSESKVRRFAWTICARPSSFFAKIVRQLWIASADGDDLWLTPDVARNVRSILVACSGIIDLTLDQSYLVDHPDLPSRPKSLTVVSRFIYFLRITDTVLSRVTHLYLLNGQLAAIPNATELPALAHITMAYCENVNMDHTVKSIAALLKSSSLRSLVVTPWQMPMPFPSTFGQSYRIARELARIDDPRAIVQSKTVDPVEYFERWKR